MRCAVLRGAAHWLAGRTDGRTPAAAGGRVGMGVAWHGHGTAWHGMAATRAVGGRMLREGEAKEHEREHDAWRAGGQGGFFFAAGRAGYDRQGEAGHGMVERGACRCNEEGQCGCCSKQASKQQQAAGGGKCACACACACNGRRRREGEGREGPNGRPALRAVLVLSVCSCGICARSRAEWLRKERCALRTVGGDARGERLVLCMAQSRYMRHGGELQLAASGITQRLDGMVEVFGDGALRRWSGCVWHIIWRTIASARMLRESKQACLSVERLALAVGCSNPLYTVGK